MRTLLQRHSLARAAGALLWLCTAAVHAQEPADLATVPVGADDELPELSLWEWAIAGNLQVDGLAHSDLDSARTKDMELRRARLSGLLHWNFDWLLRAGIDISDGPELREMSVEYRGHPVYFEIGRLVEPFGILQGGSRGAALMERPQATALAPGYGLGVALSHRGESWGLAGGIYSATKNDAFDEGGREEDAITLRATWTPLRDDDRLVHVGLAGSVRESDGGILQFTAIPESVLLVGLNAGTPLLISEGDYRLFGAELASLLGPLLLQGEYMTAELDDVASFDFSSEDFFFTFARPRYCSYYVEAAWALTGERRDYSTRRGVIGGIHPVRTVRQGSWGALELAVRTSYIDLEDPAIGGERGRVHSVGLNWFPDEQIKLMLTALDVEERGDDRTESARAVQARVQIHFTAP